jgi:hypothetical protein
VLVTAIDSTKWSAIGSLTAAVATVLVGLVTSHSLFRTRRRNYESRFEFSLGPGNEIMVTIHDPMHTTPADHGGARKR